MTDLRNRLSSGAVEMWVPRVGFSRCLRIQAGTCMEALECRTSS